MSAHLGASGYITKPVDVAQFIEAIGSLGHSWITLVRLQEHKTKAFK